MPLSLSKELGAGPAGLRDRSSCTPPERRGPEATTARPILRLARSSVVRLEHFPRSTQGTSVALAIFFFRLICQVRSSPFRALVHEAQRFTLIILPSCRKRSSGAAGRNYQWSPLWCYGLLFLGVDSCFTDYTFLFLFLTFFCL